MMPNEDFYCTVETSATAEFRDRGSKFIAYAFPIQNKEQFRIRLAELKKEHPKAAHHCFAYRLGTGGNDFRVSDDSEPSGSAGRPILGQLDSRQLTNTAVIVVRYFGGTLLGVPGLINAYKTSSSLALNDCQIIQKPILVYFQLEFDYTRMNDVMRLVKQFDCVVIRQDMQLFCTMDIGSPMKKTGQLLAQINEMKGITIKNL